MKEMRPVLYVAMLMVASYMLGVFMIVADEILSVALYCGKNCDYPYPIFGPLSI